MKFDASLFRYTPVTDQREAVKETNEATSHISDFDGWDESDLRELFEERAAIGEYESGLQQTEAESAARTWMKSRIGESRFKIWDSKTNNI